MSEKSTILSIIFIVNREILSYNGHVKTSLEEKMNRNLTSKVKECAYSIGADLVGIAPISRFKNAPIMMSPQGILPTAASVVVCAIHHLDAMEWGL